MLLQSRRNRISWRSSSGQKLITIETTPSIRRRVWLGRGVSVDSEHFLTFPTDLVAAALSFIVTRSSRGVMREDRAALQRQARLVAAEAADALALVRQLPLQDRHLFLQGFGSARLTDAVLP